MVLVLPNPLLGLGEFHEDPTVGPMWDNPEGELDPVVKKATGYGVKCYPSIQLFLGDCAPRKMTNLPYLTCQETYGLFATENEVFP